MKRILSAAGALLIVLAAVAPGASAATIGGYAGSPNGGSSKASCFSDGGWNTVTNNGSCGDTAGSWEVPLYTNAQGAWNVSVTTPGCAEPVTCSAYAVTSAGSYVFPTASSSIPANTPGSVKLAGTVNVPDLGYLFAACWLPAGCKLASVNWAQ